MAAVDAELRDFVRDALTRGISRSQIEAALRSAGWSAEQTTDGLDAFADLGLPLPVPRPKPYFSAREAFLYLTLFATLYVSAYNLGTLLFEFINRAFPDPLEHTRNWGDYKIWSDVQIRWAVSSLITAFPVFLYVSGVIARLLRKDPSKRDSRVRKWLTYVTLFLAALVVVGDLTALINGVLGGELTTRFVLKVLTVAAIAGAVFGYYLWELRDDEDAA